MPELAHTVAGEASSGMFVETAIRARFVFGSDEPTRESSTPAGNAGTKLMTDFRITAIRPDGSDNDRRIDALQLDFGNIFSIDTVIDWIKSGVHRFWVSVNGVGVWVVVRRHPNSGREYLATESDGYPPNNLLSLPYC